MKISTTKLRSFLKYSKSTGQFVWLVDRGRTAKRGQVAGHKFKNGYRYIGVEGRAYRASRLAWFYVTGEWPSHEIDHKNTQKDDDRWINLRPATKSQNGANKSPYKNNKLRLKGVYKLRRSGPKLFVAQIKKENKVIYLGCFKTKEEAHAVYYAKAKELHGNFARSQ